MIREWWMVGKEPFGDAFVFTDAGEAAETAYAIGQSVVHVSEVIQETDTIERLRNALCACIQAHETGRYESACVAYEKAKNTLRDITSNKCTEKE